MSAPQALTTAEAANAEWVISRAAPSAAMQVKVLISDVLRLPCACRADFKSSAFQARAFLDHDADGVNDFLVQASVAMRILSCERGVSMAPGCDNRARTAVVL